MRGRPLSNRGRERMYKSALPSRDLYVLEMRIRRAIRRRVRQDALQKWPAPTATSREELHGFPADYVIVDDLDSEE